MKRSSMSHLYYIFEDMDFDEAGIIEYGGKSQLEAPIYGVLPSFRSPTFAEWLLDPTSRPAGTPTSRSRL